MYKIGDYYYLMAAEGGTEYGHMVTYARSESIWGPFENYPANPVLTNRNKAPFTIQGIGHGDLVQNSDGNWYIVTLGFRQIGVWQPYHHLGREVFLTPVTFREDGWFTAGNDGTTDESYEIPGSFPRMKKALHLRQYGLEFRLVLSAPSPYGKLPFHRGRPYSEGNLHHLKRSKISYLYRFKAA